MVSAGLSNVVSNVPAVLLMEPVLQAVPADQRETAWLALAMSSTFAGNLTVLGSVANLIVVESAGRAGTKLGFVEYLKVGVVGFGIGGPLIPGDVLARGDHAALVANARRFLAATRA